MSAHIPSIDTLRARIDALAAHTPRVMLGVCGAPGAGKTTLAQRLVDSYPTGTAALVQMDGFHLAARLLEGTALAERRGAPDTFDASGYVALLERVRTSLDAAVYAPVFERSIEDPVAAAVAIEPTTRVVITEGNYLLLDDPPWVKIRRLLDEIWFVETPDAIRVDRLVARHAEFGKSVDDAHRWATGSDQRNAETIQRGRAEADYDVVVTDSAYQLERIRAH